MTHGKRQTERQTTNDKRSSVSKTDGLFARQCFFSVCLLSSGLILCVGDLQMHHVGDDEGVMMGIVNMAMEPYM